MADTAIQDDVIIFDPFDGNPIAPENRSPVIKKEEVAPPAEEKKAEEPSKKDEVATLVVDSIKELKEKLNYDDWDTAKKDIEALKTKAQTPAERKFANEESKKLALAIEAGKIEEAHEILDKHIRLNKLTNGEITEQNAPAIIKAHMKEKYKLTDAQIDYKYEKQFGIPKKPEQKAAELDEEYQERLSEWESKVADAKMEMMIEATVARPELEKLKSDLKYPEVEPVTPIQKEPTPEELALIQKNMELFVAKADEAVNSFDGFNVDYKDNDVHIKTAYKLSDEEKAVVKDTMRLLAENNYNVNAVFADRWVNDDMTFNFSQIAKDLAILESYDKSSQKFVGDAASKAKVQFIKEKHNIDLGKDGNGELQLENEDAQKKNEDAIWGLN